MPLYKIKKADLQWGIWKTDEPLEQLALLAPLGKQQLSEALRSFTNVNRQREWLAVRVLLYHLLGETKSILYQSSGKPYLSDGSYHLSISHTKGYVAVAIHPSHEVGIDIEQYATRVMRVRERFMRDDEPVAADDVYAHLLHWSGKETLFKLIGKEQVDFKEHLRILPFAVAAEGEMQACEYKSAQQRAYTLHYLTEKDFVFTWCVDSL